jgi:Acetyltransferase (GNAT) domain
VSHTLGVGEAMVAPVVVSDIGESGLRDAVSPYGFPGAVVRAPVAIDEVDWSTTGLVSVFLRDRIGAEPSLRGATLRSMVQIADPSKPLKLREQHRRHIRRNTREGYSVRVLEGPASDPDDREQFREAYRETMVRTEASSRYFFDGAWFDTVLSSPLSWLVLVDPPGGGAIAAGAIAAESDGMLHYFLGGTADEHLEASPFKNAVEAMIELASDRGEPLNLGGGIREGDSLEQFKGGFANANAAFYTCEIVGDRAAYERLSAGRGDGGFFPAYRA